MIEVTLSASTPSAVNSVSGAESKLPISFPLTDTWDQSYAAVYHVRQELKLTKRSAADEVFASYYVAGSTCVKRQFCDPMGVLNRTSTQYRPRANHFIRFTPANKSRDRPFGRI